MLQFILVERFFKLIRSSRLRWFLNRRFARAFFLPRMTREEFRLFVELAHHANTIIEYGSGGSTIWSLRNGKRIFSVDSNPDFHRFMTAIPLVREHIGDDLQLDFVDIGPTDTWGTPLSKERQSEWPKYVARPWSRVEASGFSVDMVLIDGRFRVACCLYSLRKAVEGNAGSPLIVMHDFWDRPEYHVVLPFLIEHKSAGTLASFRVKPDVDPKAVEEMLTQYTSVPR